MSVMIAAEVAVLRAQKGIVQIDTELRKVKSMRDLGTRRLVILMKIMKKRVNKYWKVQKLIVVVT